MTYRISTYNLLALVLVLMISLITKPVLGMSAHHMNMEASTSVSLISHLQPTKTSAHNVGSDCHQTLHSLSESQPECCSTPDSTASSCSDCDMSHCQPYSSYLPIGGETFSGLTSSHLIPQLTSAYPVSRTETLLRPPIV
ncbi:hypothetical protein [Photobacterium alginatilyticum]|uniref:DUF2946 domain-containing protein n=1 Tax=Photobacterium alginatilyticum TaxID=1775171 RepID=A0ABW9YGF8_9GAMM|nr:hypothetical protein [Photobacterium alginatilyticum]NBI52884.1 hypothetical protein [Photobacterium alginatilyticum]